MYAGPIIDTHFHIFRRADTPQFVLLSARAVQRDFALDDYEAAMHPAKVIGGIALQAADVGVGMDELAFVERAAPHRMLSKYVTFVPINRDDAPDIVAHLAMAHPLVAGIRYTQVVDEYGHVRGRGLALRTLRAMARRRMVFEMSPKPWQFEGMLELAAEVPEATFVLCHLGKPRVMVERQPDWRDGIERCAALPNIVCKVSAPLEGPEDPPYREDVIAPLVQRAVAAFGFDRIMFGSNFPVNFISVTCVEWLDLLERALPGATPDEQDRLYRANALRVYGIGADATRGNA